MSTQPDVNDVITDDSSTGHTSSTVSRRDFLKHSAGAVSAAGLAGMLAACSAGGFGGGSSGSGGGGSVTLNFWDMQWGGNSYFDVGKQLVTEFNNTHRGINVVYRGTP